MARVLHSLFNIVELFCRKFIVRQNIEFCGPRIDKRMTLRLYGNSSLKLNNLSARCGLLVHISNGEIIFGKNVFVNNNCSFNCRSQIAIGRDTLIGESVRIYDHDHVIEAGVVSKSNFVSKPVIIGSDCWIGSNVTILKGVTIVDNVTIGANSIVTKSITKPGTYISKSELLDISFH